MFNKCKTLGDSYIFIKPKTVGKSEITDGMSPESVIEFDVSFVLEQMLDDGRDIGPAIEDLKKRHDIDLEEISWIVFRDQEWSLEAFKRAWHDPTRKLTELDHLLIEKVFGE